MQGRRRWAASPGRGGIWRRAHSPTELSSSAHSTPRASSRLSRCGLARESKCSASGQSLTIAAADARLRTQSAHVGPAAPPPKASPRIASSLVGSISLAGSSSPPHSTVLAAPVPHSRRSPPSHRRSGASDVAAAALIASIIPGVSQPSSSPSAAAKLSGDAAGDAAGGAAGGALRRWARRQALRARREITRADVRVAMASRPSRFSCRA